MKWGVFNCWNSNQTVKLRANFKEECKHLESGTELSQIRWHGDYRVEGKAKLQGKIQIHLFIQKTVRSSSSGRGSLQSCPLGISWCKATKRNEYGITVQKHWTAKHFPLLSQYFSHTGLLQFFSHAKHSLTSSLWLRLSLSLEHSSPRNSYCGLFPHSFRFPFWW